MDFEAIQKTLKIFNFTTTNAILINLTTNMHLNKVFHFAKSWGITHGVQEGGNKKNHFFFFEPNFDRFLMLQ